MKVFVQTDVGRVRPINEDSYYLPREGERFCAIADGMGGHKGGETASAGARDGLVELLSGKTPALDSLREAAKADPDGSLQQLWDSSGTRMGAYFATFRDELGLDYTHWQSGE